MKDENAIQAEVHDSAEEANRARARILSLDVLRQELARNNAAVVLTKGTFDLLHAGHLHLVAFCARLKAEYDRAVLVIGVEDDESVRSRKKPSRPILDQEARALQMASLVGVDYVVTFGRTGLVPLVEALQPRVYVKGQDTALGPADVGKTMVQLDASERNPEIAALLRCKGRMIVLADDGGMSTTKLVTRIQSLENTK